MPIPNDQLPADVLEALRHGNVIEAIKLLRKSSGLGLKESKEIVDGHLHGKPRAASTSVGPFPSSVIGALLRGNKIGAIKLLREHAGLGLNEAKDDVDASQRTLQTMAGRSPGEVPRSDSTIWWVVAVALAAFFVYYFLRNPG